MPTPAEIAAAAKEAQIARAQARQERQAQPFMPTAPVEPEQTIDDDASPSVDTPPQLSAAEYEERIARLEQEVSAANGRVAPQQAQISAANAALAEAKRLQVLADARYEEQLKDLQAQLEAQKSTPTDIRGMLDEADLAVIDESQLKVIAKLAAAQTDAKIKALRAQQKTEFEAFTKEQENKARIDYLNYVLSDPTRKLQELPTLGNDAKFNAWLQTDEGLITDMAIRNMLNAPKQDIDRLARVVAKGIERYKGPEPTDGKKAPPVADLPTRLSQHTKRQESIDPSRMANLAAQVKRLSASRNPLDRKKAADLLAQMRTN